MLEAKNPDQKSDGGLGVPLTPPKRVSSGFVGFFGSFFGSFRFSKVNKGMYDSAKTLASKDQAKGFPVARPVRRRERGTHARAYGKEGGRVLGVDTAK